MVNRNKLLLIIGAIMVVALGIKACSLGGVAMRDSDRNIAEAASAKKAAVNPEIVKHEQHDALAVLAADERLRRQPKYVSAQPDSDNVVSVASKRLPGSFREIFCDTNDLQITAAEANGVGIISSLHSTYHLTQPLVKVATCDAYIVDSLQYSMPFLVPKAALLLRDIAVAFSDTVKARSGHECRLHVTSLTRSDYTVKRLVRRNRNASVNSCHRYGTTFDISWIHFESLDPRHILNEGDMKNVLAEILYDMREQGRCYVMWERKQNCFHITVR